MAVRQETTPNIGIAATRGWCLKYVDDTTNAQHRTASARTALNAEIATGRLRGDEPPVGVWVPGFLDLQAGSYAAVDHVFLMKNNGNGSYEIHDSETNSGQRKPYDSIAEVLGWFRAYAPVYAGWSTQCDGTVYAENYTPAASSTGVRIAHKGTATVTVAEGIRVHHSPDTNSTKVALYAKGQSFNYDSYVVVNGYVWLSYVGASGARCYVAEGPYDGNASNVWVKNGV